jgi:hypothetical protein
LEKRPVTRLYHYVGPAGILARATCHPAGVRIASAGDLLAWVRDTGQRPGPEGLVAATFVIDAHGDILLADRHAEHVACAGGGPVLSAGEMFLQVGNDVEVAEVSNQSTGFCPEPGSWPAVAAALDRIGVTHPGRFTTEVVFRRCERCGERNVVKDGWFVCALCGADLPAGWNF